jgi:hypothetical protein
MRSASSAWDKPPAIRSRRTFRPTMCRTSSGMGAIGQNVQLNCFDRKRAIDYLCGGGGRDMCGGRRRSAPRTTEQGVLVFLVFGRLV